MRFSRRSFVFALAGALVFSSFVTASPGKAGDPVEVIAAAVPFHWTLNRQPIDDNGTYQVGEATLPSSINYQGTTYIPIRLLAERMGMTVDWHAETRTADLKQAEWSEQKADDIIAFGKKWLGTPYEFDADAGQTNTFDCSSFTQYIYGKNGIKLPRNSRQQSQEGKNIAFEQIRKGDLLFFSTPDRKNKEGLNRIGHVAVYLGNGEVLHTYRVGIGVTVMKLDDSWMKRFIRAQRIID